VVFTIQINYRLFRTWPVSRVWWNSRS